MPPTPDNLPRMRDRFEIAVANFGRSCISMRSNEKAFQAWFAACVIQEFGLSRVYREVHLDKKQLFTDIPPHPYLDGLRKGNELFPDLSVSWDPDVDTRHSSNRDDDAVRMLQRMAIVSEFKVTGSTSDATPRAQVLRDLQKLTLFAMARARAGETERGCAHYMVVLDNFSPGKPHPTYTKDEFQRFLDESAGKWPPGAQTPTVLLLSPGVDGCGMRRFTDYA